MTRTLLSLLCLVPLSAEDLTSLLDGAKSPYFGCVREVGKIRLLDAESHFNHLGTSANLTFEASNNGMTAVHGAFGTLESLTAYRDSYQTLIGGWPGVWTAKDHTTTGSWHFALDIDGTTHDLSKVDWNCRTELIDNLLPITTLSGPGGRFRARLLTCAPITADGRQRPRGVIYGLELTNTGTTPLVAGILVPGYAWGRKQYDQWGQGDKFCTFDIALGDTGTFAPRIDATLAPGESRWVPVIIHEAGSGAVEAINARGTTAWIRDTLAYERSLLGRLATPDHPWVAAFYERNLLQALHAIAMSPAGRIAGSNWGSVTTTRMIWTKDFFYSALPLMGQDPDFAEGLTAWFTDNGVRPVGTVCHADDKPKAGAAAGGVSHSISLSVAGPLLGGLLYERTGDAERLRRHPEWKVRWANILDQILATRHEGRWLFPTRYISDGPVSGDIHIGSQVCVWKALAAYARLRAEVWGEPEAAKPYAEAAARVCAELLAITLATTSTAGGGRLWHEAHRKDGSSAGSVSDGEESDTTLMPFYGLLTQDAPEWKATMAFSASPANSKYTPALHAIAWEGSVPSTAPGYNKILAAAENPEALFGEHGAYTEIRHQADADGSLWWWPYGQAKQPVYGAPTRAYMNIGKAGWFSGVHSALFPARFLGLAWDAPTATLRLAPRSDLGRITWNDLPLGGAWRVHVAVDGQRVEVCNRSPAPLTLIVAGTTTQVAVGATVHVP